MTMDERIRFVDVDWSGRRVRIEYRWLGATDPEREDRPLVVFMHEGLGSLPMWKDYPRELCEAARLRGLVFSRPGYGRSEGADDDFDIDYQHRQAHEFLPAFFTAVGVDRSLDRPWLFGHSDGASIALLYAAARPRAVEGVVVLAPHTQVEDVAVQSIGQARQAYLEEGTPLRPGGSVDLGRAFCAPTLRAQ